jgi:hypothetical protein
MSFLENARTFYRKLPKGLALVFLVVVLVGAVALPVNTILGFVQSWQFLQAFFREHTAIVQFLSGHLAVILVVAGFSGLLLIFLWAAFHHEAAPSSQPATPIIGSVLGAAAGLSPIDFTERQLQIAEQHNKLLEAQLQPQFRFVYAQRCVGSDTFDALELWNDGAPVESYRIWQASYIQVFRTDIKPPKRKYIPVYYFFRRDYQGDARSGLLVTLHAWQDGSRGWAGTNMTNEYQRFSNETAERYKAEVLITKRVFLEISYADRAGTEHNATYEIYPPGHDFGPPTPRRRTGLKLTMAMPFYLKTMHAEGLDALWSSALVFDDIGEN